ncbi:Uncharacterised protein [Burkholderia pseudomallei]|nr:Uncharacterised protein [Burkholderia pseudomallei]CFL30742.1 Uncharacterised protein [Burkholderia pseudomallei]CPF73431.1 Uncharacterised protein [Burkholderia pseudomallei]
MRAPRHVHAPHRLARRRACVRVVVRVAHELRQLVRTDRDDRRRALADMEQRAVIGDLALAQPQFVVEPRQADRFEIDERADRKRARHARMAAMHGAQMPARGVPAQAQRPPRAAEPVAIGAQPIEQAGDLADDLRHRRLGRERVFGEHDVESRGERAVGHEREILLRAVLPVTAVNEDEARRTGAAAGKPVETLARPLAVSHLAPAANARVQLRAAPAKIGQHRRKIRYGPRVVVRAVERRAIHAAIQSFHRHCPVSGIGKTPRLDCRCAPPRSSIRKMRRFGTALSAFGIFPDGANRRTTPALRHPSHG